MKKNALYFILTFAIIAIIISILIFVILCKKGDGIPFGFAVSCALFVFIATYLLKLYKTNKNS